MNILVTAGNTQTPIDRVRCLTNIFSGRTGASIATRAAERGHAVTLLTSHPETADASRLRVIPYSTFEDLDAAMEREITGGSYQAVIHAAAVNDYLLDGTYAKVDGELVDASAGKVKGNHGELWLKFRPAPKIVDRIRRDWHFVGTLVKFKLEVGVSESELLEIAERSRAHSHADWMVANTLEGMRDWAYLGNGPGQYRQVARADLADAVIRALEPSPGEAATRGKIGCCP
jgi:phosphopantothenate-cysteine ligase/phosphopantothenoylcysteine decarboxylase/phosphopantothenate--cysteine ligase